MKDDIYDTIDLCAKALIQYENILSYLNVSESDQRRVSDVVNDCRDKTKQLEDTIIDLLFKYCTPSERKRLFPRGMNR